MTERAPTVLARFFRWVVSPRQRGLWIAWAVSWCVVTPWLRWYGPPQPVWSVSLQRGDPFNSQQPGECIVGSSRDGHVLWTRTGDACRFWNAATGVQRKGNAKSPRRPRFAEALSDDGERFAFLEGEGLGSQLVIVNTISGEELFRHPLQPQRLVRPQWLDAAQDWFCGSLLFAPDSSTIAVAGHCFGFRISTTQVISIETRTEIYGQSVEQLNDGDLLSFSQDGRSLLHRSVRENTQPFGTTHPACWEWIDLATGRKRAVPQSHCSGALAAWFLDGGQTIVGNTGGLSREPVAPGDHPQACHSVQLWDAVTTEAIGVFSNEEVIAISADRRTFFTKRGRDQTRTTCVRDSATGKLIAEWPASELDHEGALFLPSTSARRAMVVSSQGLFKDLDDPRYYELKRRRSWWSLIWFYRVQINVIDAETGAIVRAMPGWAKQLASDGRLLITQTDEVSWIPRKNWFPWRWTMSAYFVDAAMPWTTAAWWGIVLAIPLGSLVNRVIRRKTSASITEMLLGKSVVQRACPSCGKLSPARMAKCYHCGKVIPAN